MGAASPACRAGYHCAALPKRPEVKEAHLPMATRKKKAKTKAKSKPRTKIKVKAKKAKKATPKKRRPAAPDQGSTQQIAIAEIVGDIEERMALDRLSGE